MKVVFIVTYLATCLIIVHSSSLRDVTTSLPVNNDTKKIEKSSDNIMDRTKKLATDYLEALKKLIEAAPTSNNSMKSSRCSHNKQGLVPADLSNYEQMVIMKKYPYLDFKELDNYRSLHKNARQNLHSDPTLGQDSNFCESAVDGPNVEITNRGLSGFAIPKPAIHDNTITEQKNTIPSISQNDQSQKTQLLLKSLEEDILKFKEMRVIGDTEENK